MVGAVEIISQFRSAYEALDISWESMEVRTVCFRQGDRWVNAGTSIYPKTEEPSLDLPAFGSEVQLEFLTTIRELRDPKTLFPLLDAIFAGEAAIGSHAVQFMDTPSPGTLQPLSPTIRFQPREWSRSNFGIDFPCHVLEANASVAVINILGQTNYQAYEHGLFMIEKPVLGYDDLVRNFLGNSFGAQWWVPSVRVVVPIPVRVEGAAGRADGSVALSVEFLSGLPLDRIVISYVSDDLNQGVVERRKIALAEPADARGRIQRASIVVDSTPSRGNHFAVSYSGLPIERAEVFGARYLVANTRVNTYATTDPGLERLDTLLNSTNAGDFRKGVALLFQLLGFSVIDYESLNVPNTFDLLGLPPNREAFMAIEVTLAEADHRNKLTKISTRARSLKASAEPQDVLPVLITGSEGLGPTESEIAQKEGVAVLTRKDLFGLKSLLPGPINANRVVSSIQERLSPGSYF